MNEQDNELFEAELRRLKPARLPDELQVRLGSPPAARRRPDVRQRRMTEVGAGWQWLRWLAPAAVAGLVLLLGVARVYRSKDVGTVIPEAGSPALRADQVEIDQRLLASFDAVATLPDGEPVRFRCREWVDAVTLRDSTRDVEVVQRTPRLEIVPVSYATY